MISDMLFLAKADNRRDQARGSEMVNLAVEVQRTVRLLRSICGGARASGLALTGEGTGFTETD